MLVTFVQGIIKEEVAAAKSRATGTGRARPGLAVVGQDWPRLDHNKASEVRFIMVLAVFSGGMGNQGSQAPHGFSNGGGN